MGVGTLVCFFAAEPPEDTVADAPVEWAGELLDSLLARTALDEPVWVDASVGTIDVA